MKEFEVTTFQNPVTFGMQYLVYFQNPNIFGIRSKFTIWPYLHWFSQQDLFRTDIPSLCPYAVVTTSYWLVVLFLCGTISSLLCLILSYCVCVLRLH